MTIRKFGRRIGLTVVVGTLFLAGCSSHYGAVMIESEPGGAEVVNLETDYVMGTTPIKYWWKSPSSARQFVNVRVQKEGFKDKTTSFWINPRHSSKQDALDDPNYLKVTLEKPN
ncbi:MAG: hypothetical protein OEU36_23240 [Gammaproteobacteria bacterium]|nr:hypothetical protein [Gammaproteobacteria bacterium]